MPTDTVAPVALFLFAHQDDEFGVFARIEQERRAGRRVQCIYVTDGAATADASRRDAESLAVLRKLGVEPQDVLFAGGQLGIGDGQLHRHAQKLHDWLGAFVDANPALDSFFAPAWEGGHPDHDLLHAVTVELLAARGRLEQAWQYPLYNGRNCRGPFFRLQSPLPANGPVQRQPIGWRDRLRYVRLCLGYPSQWRTWVGLFPFVCLHYLRGGAQQLQPMARRRLDQPPHARPLYYERRAFLDWPTLHAAVAALRRHGQR